MEEESECLAYSQSVFGQDMWDPFVPLQKPSPSRHRHVYMPSSDQSKEAYVDYLNEVDSLLSRLPSNDPIVVMGDLNCHLDCHQAGLPTSWRLQVY